MLVFLKLKQICEKVIPYFLSDIQSCSAQRNERTIIRILLQMDIHPKLSEMQASILLDSMRMYFYYFFKLIDSLKQIITAPLDKLISTVPLDRVLLRRIYLYLHPDSIDTNSSVCSTT